MNADKNEKIQLEVGESTTVTCKGLGTAGYQWNYNVDKDELITISKDYVSQGKQPTGGSADEVFTIKALKKGTVVINFFQKRSWEANGKAIDEKILTITIE